MSQYKKLLEEMKRNPHKVNFDDLEKVLLKEGFIRRQSGKGTSHYVYARGSQVLTIPKKYPVNEIYVKQALEYLGI